MCQKLNILFFTNQAKEAKLPSLSKNYIYINNNQIQRSESIKFLGVFLDENLTWEEHI